MPSIASGRTSAGAIIGVKPAATARAIARLTSASSSSAPGPVRNANREPETFAPRSVSIALMTSPTSRWSRTAKS